MTLDGCNIGLDAVSQIVVLTSPPSHSKSRMKIYCTNISIHPYKLAQLTGQLKENIVFWINQKKAFNPADLLGKFDIDKDQVSRWMELAKKVLQPSWLQQNPDTYLRNMLEESNEKILELTAGKHTKQPVDKEQSLTHDCAELKQGGDLMINFINVQDRFTPISNKPVDFQPLETVVTRNKFKGSNYYLKIMGYATWITCHWRDNVYLRKYSTCNHQ